jgi:hypothetical protein
MSFDPELPQPLNAVPISEDAATAPEVFKNVLRDEECVAMPSLQM